MDSHDSLSIDIYPWAAPTEAQRAWFDALSPEARRREIRMAIGEGFSGPLSAKSVEDIIREARVQS